mmetsp:Transcript_20240/g.43840  ORF Transcript_20240/g.43840 Transcript_20240/m.43840 type:complete len:165 (+) Transcript_20240:79-573(+)
MGSLPTLYLLRAHTTVVDTHILFMQLFSSVSIALFTVAFAVYFQYLELKGPNTGSAVGDVVLAAPIAIGQAFGFITKLFIVVAVLSLPTVVASVPFFVRTGPIWHQGTAGKVYVCCLSFVSLVSWGFMLFLLFQTISTVRTHLKRKGYEKVPENEQSETDSKHT